MFTIGLFSESAPEVNVTWLLWVALGFFAVIVVVGWLVSRRRKPEEEQVHVSGHEAHEAHENTEPDDLTKLEGIGPKVAGILEKAGIITYADLAEAGAEKVDAILDASNLHMMDSAGWIDQAKLAAAGDWDRLIKLQAELKGGRRKE